MSSDTPNVLETMVQLEQVRTHAKAANKFPLDTEKEKDTAEQVVQRLQQVLQVKRARTHAITVKDHEECDKKSSDDMDLTDHRREVTRCVSRGSLLDVSGCSRSKLTVWKEDQFTVLPEQGIKQREKRVSQWVAKVLPLTKPGVWGCVQARTQWSTEEDTHRRPESLTSEVGGLQGHPLLHRRLCSRHQVVAQQSGGGCVRTHVPGLSGRRTLTHHDHLWL